MLSLEDPTSLKSFLPFDSISLELVSARKLDFGVIFCFSKSIPGVPREQTQHHPQHHIENSVVTH